jgi:hypothetical protein
MHNIRIGIKQAKIALSDKDRLVAFCFALKIKFLFRASDLHYGSKNQAAKALGFNKPTFTQYLDLAIKFGYCRIETNKFGVKKIIANKIHSKDYSYKTRRGQLRNLSLPSLKNLVREAVICNKINIIEEVINTHSRAVNGHSIKSVRNARKTEARMLEKPFDKKYTGSYSNSRMMQDINGTMYQAKKAIKSLVKSGTVQKIIQCTEANVDACVCTNNQTFRASDGTLIIISAKYRKGQLRCANKYKVLTNRISKAKSGTNQKKVEHRMKWVKNRT